VSACARCTDDQNHIFRLQNLRAAGGGGYWGGGIDTHVGGESKRYTYKSAQVLCEIDCE